MRTSIILSVMDKLTAIRVLTGSDVLFRGRRHSVISVKSGQQSEAPFFRLRALDDGAVTGLISHRMLEPALEESGVRRSQTRDSSNNPLAPRFGPRIHGCAAEVQLSGSSGMRG